MRCLNKIFLCSLATLLFARASALSQTLPSGPQVLTFFSEVDDTEQPFGLYLPPRFDQNKKYPLVIMLHGAGSNHRLALRRVFGKSNQNDETDVEATRYFPEWQDVEYIVATPYARGTMGYQGIAEKDVYDVLAEVKRRFPIDEDRVYLTGLSMGGGGTLWLGLSRPDIWAGLAPVCPAPPDGTAELAPNALNTPMHIFHGDADPVVTPASVREWVARLKELETKVEYTEYPGVSHNSWENAYQNGAIFKWFGQFRRERFPQRVRFTSSRYKYDRAYWVRIDELTPGTQASLDAKFLAPNRLEITTSALSAFTLTLNGHPQFDPSRTLELKIDGAKVSTSTKGEASFVKRKGKWSATIYEAKTNTKRAGAEGPIAEAITERHIYVFGTADNPAQEVLQARREQALLAANWSADRGEFLGRVKIFPRVLADREIRPSDIASSNLILFGTKENNSIIVKFSAQLPLQFNATTNDYGLIYIFPMGQRYVVVNSGLPWWSTSAGRAIGASNRRGFRPIFGPPGLLMDLPDYVLFQGSLDNVIAQGRFEPDWSIASEAMAKMSASGAVSPQTKP